MQISSFMTRFFQVAALTVALLCSFVLPASAYVIEGQVRGADGLPPAFAHVYLSRGALQDAAIRERVASDGHFALHSEKPGFVTLFVGAAGYRMLDARLPLGAAGIGDTIRLDINLARIDVPGDLESFLVRRRGPDGNFLRAEEIKPNKDGTFRTRLAADSGASTIVYRMSAVYSEAGGARGVAPWADPTADRQEPNENGLYSAERDLAEAGDTITIEWEAPERHNDRATLEFDDRLTGLLTHILQGVADGKPFDSLATRRSNQARSAILAERRAPLRRALLLAYLACHRDGNLPFDELLTRMAYSEIDAQSIMWSIRPELLIDEWYAREDSAAAATLIDRAYAGHPDPDVRAFVLYARLKAAESEEARRNWLDSLTTNFPTSAWVELARMEAPSAGPLAVGRKIPSFALQDLDSLERVLTPESLSGSVYVIDFWSTWCRECVAGLDSLSAAWQRYRNDGLEVISVAFEPSEGNVRKFQRQVIAMPWINVLENQGPQSEIAKQFDVRGLPLTILVDEEGRIIAAGRDLRGARLMDALQETFAQRK